MTALIRRTGTAPAWALLSDRRVRALPVFAILLVSFAATAVSADVKHGGGEQQADAQARERAREQARQRAAAQAERRAQAHADQLAHAQSKGLAEEQERAQPRRQGEGQERTQAHARRHADAQARQRERAQTQARQPRGQPEQGQADPQRAHQRKADRARAERKTDGARGENGPDDGPARDHPLQNGSRQAGSIARGGPKRGQAKQATPADWTAKSDRYAKPPKPYDFNQASKQIDQSKRAYEQGMKSSTRSTSRNEWGSGGYSRRGHGRSYGGGGRNRTETWVSDDRPYRPTNNEFYAVDAKRAAAAARDRAGKTGEQAVSGARVGQLPDHAVELAGDGDPLYYNGGVFYRSLDGDAGFEVVEPPIGTIVPSLPSGSGKIDIQDTRYDVFNGVYYKSVYVAGEFAFKVAQVNR